MTDDSVCGFDEAWIGRCKAPGTNPDGRCDKHAGLLCVCCGEMATRSCDHTGIQFVCGAPLCNDCRHGIAKPGELGMFNLGGGHHPGAVVDQQIRDLIAADRAARKEPAQ